MKSNKNQGIAFFAHNEKNVLNDSFIHNNPTNSPYVILVKKLKELNYIIHTLDVFKIQKKDPSLCIFLDIPPIPINNLINLNVTKSIVLLREAEMICPRNYSFEAQSQFDFIMTWKKDLIDNQVFFHLPSTKLNLKEQFFPKGQLKDKLICLVNRNLSSNQNGELYSERKKVINWYEKNNFENFDLYGYNWDKYNFLLNARNFYLPTFFKKKTYKGKTENKINTLSKYKFSICFENTSKVNHYVSEKIFDSFLSGTVPIYYGCPNICQIIPSSCFIDYRNFDSVSDLNEYISSIDDEIFNEYLESINLFLNSNKVQEFSLETWLNSICKLIKKALSE